MECFSVSVRSLINSVTDLGSFFGLGETLQNLTYLYSRKVCLHITRNELC